VSFNLSFQSFESHIRGVRDLIDLSVSSPDRPPILFASSVGAVGNWGKPHDGRDVPMELIEEFAAPVANGLC
jgi:hypothetical protein